MIGAQGYYEYLAGKRADTSLNAVRERAERLLNIHRGFEQSVENTAVFRVGE